MGAVSPEAKARAKAASRLFYQRNRQRILQRQKERKLSNPERVKARQNVATAKYRAANLVTLKSKQRIAARRRRGSVGVGRSFDQVRRRFGRRPGALVGDIDRRMTVLFGGGTEDALLAAVELRRLLELYERGKLDRDVSRRVEVALAAEAIRGDDAN